MIYKIQSEFFYNTCLSRIMDLITVTGGDKKTIAKGLLDKYIQRTILHINLVCESSKILADHYCENTGVDKETYFRRISNHDADKLNNEDTVVYYAVACEKVYGTGTEEWDCPQEVIDRWENVEWPKHWERHTHHVPEHFGRKEDGVWRVDTNVDRYALTEMVADWTAMWLELGHKSPKSWLNQEHGNSFVLTGGDLDYVNGCCELVEKSINQIAAIREKYNLAPPKEDQSTESIEVGKEWKENDVKNITTLRAFLSSVKYGFGIDPKDNFKTWKLTTVADMLKNKIGTCYDTAFVADYFLKKIKNSHKCYFICQQGRTSVMNNRTHTFNLYLDDSDEWRWLEASWGPYRKNNFHSKNVHELMQLIARLHANMCKTSVDVRSITSWPATGCNMEVFVKHMVESSVISTIEPGKIDLNQEEEKKEQNQQSAPSQKLEREQILKKEEAESEWNKKPSGESFSFESFSMESIPAQYQKLVFENNPVKRKIYGMARGYYEDTGSHGYEHIKEVLATAYVLKGKKDLNNLEYTTILYHDVGRGFTDKDEEHNIISEKIARRDLPKTHLFTDEELEKIYRAVLWHRSGWRKDNGIEDKDLDPLSELMANADKGFPQTTYYDICLRPTLWILEGRDVVANPEKYERLHHYQSVDDIAQGVKETLERLKAKRFDRNDTSLHARVFAKEKKLQIELSEKITIDDIKKVVVEIAKNYGYTLPNVSTESFSFEAKGSDDKRGKISDADKKKLGEYLYHGTHRDLDIKSLGIHVCKNRASTDIEAPVVYMNRSLAVACLHCVPFMVGHGSKMKDYKEHFVDLDKAISSSDKMTEVEIVHNDPDLKECSGENDGYIYCVKKSECANDLYYATPDKPNDWNFVAYKQLPIAKKMRVKIKWHKKYDEAFAKKVKAGYMAVESLEASAAFEDIHHNVEQHIKDNKVYHCSPQKYDKLEMKYMGKWYADKKGIFVTPFASIASCFIIDKQNILDKLDKEGIDTHDNPINFKYDVWDKKIDELGTMPKHINVTIQGCTGFKPFNGKATGYIYTIDYSKYKDKTSMFKKSETSDVEFIINSDIIPEKVAKISVDYTVRPGKAVSNEDFLGVGKIYKELSSRKHYDNLFDFMKMQKYTRFAYEATHKKTLRNRNPHNIHDIDLNTVGVIDKYILQTVGKMDHDNLSKEDAVLNCFTHYYDLNVRDMRDREIPFEVERPGISISPQGRNERIQHIKARIDELTKFKTISANYIQHFKRCLDIHKTTYPSLNIDKFCDQMSSYLPSLKAYFDKWCQFYLKEYQLELKYLQEQKPSAEAFDASKFKPIEIDKNPAPDRFANDTMKINRIDPSTLNQDIIKVLEKQDEYLEIVRRWLTVPDYSLTPKLIEFGKFVDKLYGFDKEFVAYRAMRIGKSTLPIQQSMGIIDNTEIIKKPKPFVVPGYKFTYMNTGPLSVTRAIWVSKVYGDLIVKTKVRPETSKLVITNELAYVLQALDEKYPYYRPLNLSALTEVLLFPDQTLNYQVVTTNGDILSEMPEFKAMNFKDKKIDLDASMSIGEEGLTELLVDTKTVKIGTENLLIANEKLEIKHDYILDKLKEGTRLTIQGIKDTIQPGDILIPYPKDKDQSTFMQIFHAAERTVYGMSFTSCKLVHEKNIIIGYGVKNKIEKGKSAFDKTTIDDFIKHCGGLMILRTKHPIPPTKLKKLHEFMERYYKDTRNHDFSYWDATVGTLAYLLNCFQGELDPKKLDPEDYNKLVCSSVVAAAFKWSDIDLGLPRIKINRIMPIHMTMSDKLKCVGYWFARGEWNPQIENQIAALDANESVSEEALSEAAISKKKKEIIDKICKICDIMDPSKLNSNRYHKILDKMSPKEFNQWMTYVKDGKWVLHIVAPNMVVNLRNENLLKAADAVGVKLFHRIWMHDPNTDRTFLTDNEYLVLPLPIRRQQQFLDEKMSVPEDDKHIDGMTGQVTGDSKSTQITNPEINILAFRGLDTTLEEMVNVRGGNMVAYGEFRKQAEETGEVHMNELDPTTRSRTAVIAQVLLNAMHIENNIV